MNKFVGFELFALTKSLKNFGMEYFATDIQNTLFRFPLNFKTKDVT